MFLRNADSHLYDYMASKLRMAQSTSALLWECQTSINIYTMLMRQGTHVNKETFLTLNLRHHLLLPAFENTFDNYTLKIAVVKYKITELTSIFIHWYKVIYGSYMPVTISCSPILIPKTCELCIRNLIYYTKNTFLIFANREYLQRGNDAESLQSE